MFTCSRRFTLQVAAIAICESVNTSDTISFGRGFGGSDLVRPNVCVSPHDLIRQPYLHEFYFKLGFRGGRPDRGGNYTLPVEATETILASYAPRPPNKEQNNET